MSVNYISFRGTIGKNLERKVTVTPLKNYPFKIKNVTVKNEKELDLSWREVPGKEINSYEITVRNTRTEPGRVRNTVIIQTDSNIKPELTINVGGYLQGPSKGGKKPQPATNKGH